MRLNNKKINVFNYGNHARDFTYIDDVVKIIRKLVKKPSRKDKHFNYRLPNPSSSTAPFKILNLSSGKKIGIMSLLKEIEKKLKIKATVKFLKKQKGDVEETCSSIKKMSNYIKLKKRVDYRKGIKKFINWYLNYYNI